MRAANQQKNIRRRSNSQEGTLIMPRILLVEDNPDNRDMLSRRLERKGTAENIRTPAVAAFGLDEVVAPALLQLRLLAPNLLAHGREPATMIPDAISSPCGISGLQTNLAGAPALK